MGLLAGVHLGTPCSSFSRARDIPGGPPPLRSDSEPWGRAAITSQADLMKIKIGNTLAQFSIGVFELCRRLGVIVSLENPELSRIWLLPSFHEMQSRPKVGIEITDFCQDGTKWRKRTRILYANCDLSGIGKKCTGIKGICSRTGEKHQHLQGKTSSGVFRTLVAEPYPRPLCQRWARAIDNALASRVVGSMSLALQSER